MRLYSTEVILGRPIAAADDDIGKCIDVLVDDRNWTLRYLVVDTGQWLTGRKVVLSPTELSRNGPFTPTEHIPTRLTRDQVRESPSLDEHAPVSRRLEKQLAAYYGWPAYWEGGGLWGSPTPPATAPTPEPEDNAPLDETADAAGTGVHLHSAKELAHYVNQAADGDLGVIKDLLFDPHAWQVRYLVLKTSRWFGGATRVMPTSWITRVDTIGKAILTERSRDQIRGCPEIPIEGIVDAEVGEQLRAHFESATKHR